MVCEQPAENSLMHPSTRRLFMAIAQVKGVDGRHEPGRVAQLLGESAATVTNWKTRGVSKSGTLKAHALFGISPTWIASEEGDMLANATATSVKFSTAADEAPEFLSAAGLVPLISWVTAGCWADISDPYEPGVAEDDTWLPCPARHGARTYCLRVRGDSMNNPGSRPSYSDGDIIFVDPDRDAQPGDRVIVRLDDQKEATFKQLLVEDGRKMLKALNPEWRPRYVEINGNATITGVVIGKWVPE